MLFTHLLTRPRTLSYFSRNPLSSTHCEIILPLCNNGFPEELENTEKKLCGLCGSQEKVRGNFRTRDV